MRKTEYIVRKYNGKDYGFRATRVIVKNNNFSQKVYDFGTERFPSGCRIVVRVWNNEQRRMVAYKLDECTMVEAIVTDCETKEQFTWNGKIVVK